MGHFGNFHIISKLVVVKNKFLKVLKTIQAIECADEKNNYYKIKKKHGLTHTVTVRIQEDLGRL